MSPDEQKYDQPEKNEVRRRIIHESVKALTGERSSSAVVTLDNFQKTLNYSSEWLAKHCGNNLSESLKPHVESWIGLHTARVGTKKPSEIQVLFLAGPDPVKDIREFQAQGIALENIWAIESDATTFARAVAATEEHGLRIKLHRGSLQSFFALVPQQFDIVYFDATAPVFGGKPNTMLTIQELVLKQRLAPLSVLITNFAEANKDGKSDELWGNRIGAWAYANGINDDWLHGFHGFVNGYVMPQFHQMYGEFITKFLIKYCAQIVPW